MTLEELIQNNMFPRKANRANEVWVRCPFCDDEQYRMGINVVKGLAHCFRASCEWKTNDKKSLFRALSDIFNNQERMDDQRIVKDKKPVAKTIGPQSLPKEFESLYHSKSRKDYDEIGRAALDYLYGRGVAWWQIQKYKLGFCAVGDYSWRIIIPVYRKGKLVSFTARNFSETDVEPKYLNSKGSKYLYAVPRGKKKDACVLIEGPVDVWAVERADESIDPLGRLGSGLTKSTTRELRNWDEIILWPDPDTGGCEIAISAAYQLAGAGKKVSIIMPHDDDVDPGKMGETEAGLLEIKYMIRTRVPWSEHAALKLKAFGAFQPHSHKKRVSL